jgi:hypothetical protein
MNREEFTIYLNTLEKKYPVNDWKIDGVHIWPLIKIQLSFSFNTPAKAKKEQFKSESTALKLKKTFRGFIDYSKLLLIGKAKIPTKLFCLAPHFRFYNGKHYINRYFNQLIDESINTKSDFLFGEYGNTTKEYRTNIDFPDKTIYFENLKYLALFLREFSWKKYSRRTNWPEFDSFISEVNEHLKYKKLYKNEILKKFIYIRILKDLYKLALEKYTVNEVYILCYYVSEMYAMNLATAELGITSWDIQHGGQGSLHIAYSNFNVIPNAGYKLLPKKFWTWDTASALEIYNWVVNQDYHEVEVKGNHWLEYCVQRYSTEIDTSRKIILYTMQPIGNFLLDNYIVEAIKKTPPDYIWWLRLHPRQLMEKKKLVTLLEENNIMDRVNIEEATMFPLPSILNKTHVHLSKYSGSILEAYIMKVKTIVLSEIGVESFPEVVESEYGIVCLNKSGDKLFELLFKNHE